MAFDQHLYVQAHQSASMPKGLRHEWIKTPTQSQANWGSQFIVNFNLKGVSLDDVWLEFSMPTLSGLTVANSGTAALVPCPLWISRLEVQIGTLTVDTITGISNFLAYQLFTPSTAQASALNKAIGDYSSHTT